jgi:transposase
MPRKISRDVKIAAVKLYECHLLDVDDILDCCNFSRRTWFQILKLWRETGDVVSEAQSISGRLRTLDYDDIHYLQNLIEDNPDYFLDELLHLLKTNRFISLHFTTVFRELQRARVSHKKLQRIAREQDEDRRIDFMRRMVQYDPEELGFIDEVSRDERSIGRHYGWSKKSRRAKKKQPFVWGRCTSTVGVLTLDGFVAGTTVEGSLTKEILLEWLEFNIVGVLVLFLISLLTNFLATKM